MDFVLIIRALSRQKLIVAMLVIQCAVSMALFINGFEILSQRMESVFYDSGVRQSELLYAKAVIHGSAQQFFDQNEYYTLIERIAHIPGVDSVSTANALPFSDIKIAESLVSASLVNSASEGLGGAIKASIYYGDRSFMPTAGIKLIEGRKFAVDEYTKATSLGMTASGVVILNKSLAKRLFHKSDALGKQVVLDGKSLTVVGIVSDVARPAYYGSEDTAHSLFLPAVPFDDRVGRVIVIRSNGTASVDDLAKSVGKLIPKPYSFQVRTLNDARSGYFSFDLLVIKIIIFALVALCAVVLCGLMGLCQFWVLQRRPQIAILRALGARRLDIMVFLSKENFVICGIGLVLGIVSAVILNTYFKDRFGLERISAQILVISSFTVLIIGQLSVIGAARRISLVDPAVAARA